LDELQHRQWPFGFMYISKESTIDTEFMKRLVPIGIVHHLTLPSLDQSVELQLLPLPASLTYSFCIRNELWEKSFRPRTLRPKEYV
jgi:hypothetical protein